MPTKKKQVLIPGRKYRSPRADGSYLEFDATQEVIDKIVESGNDLLANGYLIPVPFEHDLDVMLSLKNEKGKKGKKSLLEDLNRNAGFVQKFYKEEDGSLWLDLDIPNPEIAEKLGKEIRGASIALKREFNDIDVTRGKKWEFAPLHLALTNKPVAIGTSNFQDVIALSLEEEVDGKADDLIEESDENLEKPSSDDRLNKLRAVLKEKLNVDLTDITNETNLLDNLILILGNIPKMVPETEANQEEVPDNFNQEEKQKLDKESKQVPPGSKRVQGPPETGIYAMSVEELREQLQKVEKENLILMSRHMETVEKDFRKRAAALERRGVDKNVIQNRILKHLENKDKKGELLLLSQETADHVESALSLLEETFPAPDMEELALLSQETTTVNRHREQDDDEAALKEIAENLRQFSF